MSAKRSGLTLVTINNKVLAFGGSSGEYPDYYFPTSVEEFNLEEETWSVAPYSLDEARSRFGYLVLPEDKICG